MDFNEYNIKQTNKIPINRNNMFYSEESYNFELEIGMQYLTMDVNQTVVLYQVDLEKSNFDDIYKETRSRGLVFKPPVEIHCIYEIDEPELKSYDKSKNLGTYVKTGNLHFGVFQATLDELECEIKIGDYIGIVTSNDHMEMFVVTNDGRINTANNMTTYGYKSAWRKIEATPTTINDSEFDKSNIVI